MTFRFAADVEFGLVMFDIDSLVTDSSRNEHFAQVTGWAEHYWRVLEHNENAQENCYDLIATSDFSIMKINLTPEQEQIVNDELRSGHFRSAEEVIATALVVLREKERSSAGGDSNGRQENAVREMLNFVEENRTPLQGISVKQLIREGHRL